MKIIVVFCIFLFLTTAHGNETDYRKIEQACEENQASLHLFFKDWKDKNIPGFWPALEKQLASKKLCTDGAYGEDDILPNALIDKWKYISEVSKTSVEFQNKLIKSINATLGGEPEKIYNLSSSKCPGSLSNWCINLKKKCILVLKEQGVKIKY